MTATLTPAPRIPAAWTAGVPMCSTPQAFSYSRSPVSPTWSIGKSVTGKSGSTDVTAGSFASCLSWPFGIRADTPSTIPSSARTVPPYFSMIRWAFRPSSPWNVTIVLASSPLAGSAAYATGAATSPPIAAATRSRTDARRVVRGMTDSLQPPESDHSRTERAVTVRLRSTPNNTRNRATVPGCTGGSRGPAAPTMSAMLANPDATPPSQPRPAATVVLLRPAGSGGRRRPEVLLTRRPATMAFAGDAFVFPGGRVDDADADPRLVDRLAAPLPAGGPPYAIAAIRELLEEAGILLAERRDGAAPDQAAIAGARRALLENETTLAAVAEALDLRPRTDLLAPIAHWTTPPIMPRRFATQFFVAELPAGAEPTFAIEEVTDHRWLEARDALDAMGAGEIAMWVPTSATLQQLEHASSFAEIAATIVPGDAPAPRVIGERPGLARIVVESAGAVPGQTVNAYLVGQGEFVLVDPGDPSDAAADAILGTVLAADGRLVAIALTHVDPDHAAGAEGLALRLDVPILA